MMKKTVNCTKEEPLHKQISEEEKFLIEELTVTGFLADEDYVFLTEMCQEQGRLRVLDLFGVNETDCYADDENYWSKNQVAISNEVFCDCVRLEKIVFPEKLAGIGHESFINCENLVEADFPDTLHCIGFDTFYDCKKLNEIFIPAKNFGMGGIGLSLNFAGCASSFHCDNEKWPFDENGEKMYTENDDEYVYISKDGVLFFYYDEDDFSLCKYPSESETTVYETPLDVTKIEGGAFARCKNLRKLIINSYIFQYCAICDCPNLETLVFKVQGAGCSRISSFDLDGYPIIANCPKLQDIYLYCEEPENMNDLFSQVKGLENIVLHVPCFCAKKYREHLNVPYTEIYAAKCHLPPLTEEAIRQYNEDHPPAWRRFKRIEEFDPVDVFGDEIIEFF